MGPELVGAVESRDVARRSHGVNVQFAKAMPGHVSRDELVPWGEPKSEKSAGGLW